MQNQNALVEVLNFECVTLMKMMYLTCIYKYFGIFLHRIFDAEFNHEVIFVKLIISALLFSSWLKGLYDQTANIKQCSDFSAAQICPLFQMNLNTISLHIMQSIIRPSLRWPDDRSDVCMGPIRNNVSINISRVNKPLNLFNIFLQVCPEDGESLCRLCGQWQDDKRLGGLHPWPEEVSMVSNTVQQGS